MTKAQERVLQLEAAKRGYSEDRTRRFVYGTMRRHGWIPRKERLPGRRGGR